jgi:ATP-dependent DNA helicase RecG
MLVMTATPIPRTVAMTVFGDLETSVLAERPAGRADTVTHLVPADNPAWIDRTWARVREEVDKGGRAYVVCARIDPSELPDAVDDSEADDVLPLEPAKERPPLAAATEVAAMLTDRPELAGVRIGLMHGRLSSEDKDVAMARFASGETPVLVSTTVIEVGVDVPEATAMVILDADRFGISQLHQLRGRVGRSSAPGVCLLVTSAEEGTLAHERLAALAATTDGFELAEKDLELRREGDVLGAGQSGRSSLRLLRVVRDAALIAKARDDARTVVEQDPSLDAHPALASAIRDWLGETQEEFLERA